MKFRARGKDLGFRISGYHSQNQNGETPMEKKMEHETEARSLQTTMSGRLYLTRNLQPKDVEVIWTPILDHYKIMLTLEVSIRDYKAFPANNCCFPLPSLDVSWEYYNHPNSVQGASSLHGPR